MELSSWPSQALSTTVLAILIQEVVGFDVSIFEADDSMYAAERMSSKGRGICTPTHMNVEVDTVIAISPYANQTTSSSIGYTSQIGIYTLRSNVMTALKGDAADGFSRSYSAEFWREYVQSTELVEFYSIQQTLNLTRIARPEVCPDGMMGCRNGCEKNSACTAAEAKGEHCVVIAMMTPDVYPGYAQAMVANCLIPAYYCFAGYDGLNEYVMDTMAANGTILFFHFEPDIFHFDNVGKFARVAFPPTDPERVALSRGVFGVLGYGMPTQNPVDVDFPDATLMKTFPAFLDDDEHLHQLLTRFQITARRMTTLLGNYSVHRRNKAVTNPVFTTACQWVQTNFRTWSAWIDTLPLCTIHLHMNYTIAEVNNGTARRVTFQWIRPDPDNASLPYVCEGGMLELPRPLFSSKSAKWLKNNFAKWNDWLATPPPCDRSHYSYSIDACNQESRRQVSFFWVVPGDGGSLECVDGISLPPTTSVSCDYVPTSSSAFQGITMLSCIIFSLLLICGIVIVVFREKAVVKRSQWPLLVLIVIGGMILCVDIILGAYQSTDMICGSLLILDSLSFSMIFVAILVKCLRVYLVFNNKAMKKITVSLWKMLKLYSLIVTIDIGIVVVGLLVDYPNATIFTTPATEFDGDVDHVTCKSTGLVFSALSLFWKILIVGTGLYFAFLIRHADSDFQETKWIVASAVVMVVGGIVMIPLMYMTMSTALSFTLRSLVLLFGMVLVIAFMVMPKLWRLGKIKSTSAKTPAVKNSEQLSSDAIHVEDKTTGKVGAKR
ncbi:hypothetical protein, variant 1 [Aphanomyces invadans]|nr:hypothetical protein, variant 1 [Aphanomyces invadans]ETW10209.1 hypothetical protein, variant 1 [Aphanomyces invadans]|eukprot:XP_008861622.1 hypothetical protein, variant 1 [Aphanomyces invadans]